MPRVRGRVPIEDLMLSLSTNPVAKLSFDTFRLGCEAHSLMGLRLFAMATGGGPPLPEALRMTPEKIAALAEAEMIIAIGILSGRPDLAPGGGFPLYPGG